MLVGLLSTGSLALTGHPYLFPAMLVLESKRKLKKQPPAKLPSRVGEWFVPAIIQPNNFVYKSLSNWSFNTAVGCSHGCRFCYVPSASTIKQAPNLVQYGVKDPDAEWGQYVLIRPWDEDRFLASLRAANSMPRKDLARDGNRAVMYSTTTDPYQTINHPDPAEGKRLRELARLVVRRSLELIRDNSTLNVRILTRSPMAKLDFDLYRSFGKRLVFGMSLPTLRNDLSKVYEPKAPAPSQRLATLQAAVSAGLHVFVAMAPTYPECDRSDLLKTLSAIAELKPITVFHEPINIRAENVSRIEAQAKAVGLKLQSEVFASRESWRNYALQALKNVWELSEEAGLRERIHLWPDKALGSAEVVASMPKPKQYQKWLMTRWKRISEWPK
jgi:DNA repair photolyase